VDPEGELIRPKKHKQTRTQPKKEEEKTTGRKKRPAKLHRTIPHTLRGRLYGGGNVAQKKKTHPCKTKNGTKKNKKLV